MESLDMYSLARVDKDALSLNVKRRKGRKKRSARSSLLVLFDLSFDLEISANTYQRCFSRIDMSKDPQVPDLRDIGIRRSEGGDSRRQADGGGGVKRSRTE